MGIFEAIEYYQVNILIGAGIICALMAVFISVIRFQSVRKKVTLLRIELGIAILLIADALAYLFDGDPSSTGYWINRIAEFLVYIFTLTNVFFLSGYITELFMETGRFKRLPRRLLAGFLVPVFGMLLVVISQFTGIYYYYDETNVYQRGPFYLVGFILPFAAILVLFSFVMQYRRHIHRRLVISLVIFTMLPIASAMLQIVFYGISFIDLGCCLAAILLFIFALYDQNVVLNKAVSTEAATGLPNAYGFQYEVDRIIHYGDITKYCAYYFDIVRMSRINNKYGKPAGDEAIYNYANGIRRMLDDSEIIARLGGNFFAALVKKTKTERFLKLLNDIPVEITTEKGKETIHMAAIAGAYEVKTRNVTSGQLLTFASTAMTHAKNVVHKPYVFLDEQLQAELDSQRHMEEKIKKALALGEFEPYYQPKVDSAESILCGAEALCRWKSDGKMISPAQFIPVMEKNGSICELDFYILRKVCQDIKTWMEKGMNPVQVSVNFSRKNLGNPILAEAISKVVEEYDIPKELIQIEVTETLDEYPMAYLIGVVDALRRYGLSTAIDDFGTGSSSIKLLKDIQFDYLKIDKDFVDYKNERDKQLLGEIIAIAKNRESRVVAEGVEELSQVEELKQMDCFLIQGYVFDRPLPKEEYEQRLMIRRYAI